MLSIQSNLELIFNIKNDLSKDLFTTFHNTKRILRADESSPHTVGTNHSDEKI